MTDTCEDRQLIQKTVRLSQTEGIALLVDKLKDRIYPETISVPLKLGRS